MKVNVCSASYAKEKDLPAGQKLLRCSKCKEAFYVDRAHQLENWKYHRHSCVPIEKDDPRVRKPLSSTRECLDIMHWCLEKPKERIKGRLFLWAFRCFKWFRQNRPHEMTPGTLRNELYKLHFQTLVQVDQNYGHEMFKVIFAIPGCASFFMDDELFLTQTVKELKAKGLPAPRPQVFLSESSIDPATKLDSSYEMDYLFCRFALCLMGASMNDGGSDKDGRSTFCGKTALASAAVRQTMTFWKCRYTSACFSGPARNLVFSGGVFPLAYMPKVEAMTRGDPVLIPGAKKNELVPGLTVPDLIEILHWEGRNFFAQYPTEQKGRLMSYLVEVEGNDQENGRPWDLCPRDRLRLITLVKETDLPKIDWTIEIDETTVLTFDDIEDVLLYLITGCYSTKTMLEMYEYCTSEERDSREFRAVASQVKMNYNLFLKQIKPTVADEMKQMEDRLHRQGYEGASFPDDLLNHVTEYAFPDSIQCWASFRLRGEDGQSVPLGSALEALQTKATEYAEGGVYPAQGITTSYVHI